MCASEHSEQHSPDSDVADRHMVGSDPGADEDASCARVFVPWCCVFGHGLIPNSVGMRRCMTVWIFGGAPGCF